MKMQKAQIANRGQRRSKEEKSRGRRREEGAEERGAKSKEEE